MERPIIKRLNDDPGYSRFRTHDNYQLAREEEAMEEFQAKRAAAKAAQAEGEKP
jgi:hypothetical protein